MSDCVLIKTGFDLNGVLEEIEAVSKEYCYPHPGNPNKWFGIPFRNASGTKSITGIKLNHTLDQRIGKMKSCSNSPLLTSMPKCIQLISKVAELGEIFLVRVLILKAGGKIKTHSDGKAFSFQKGKHYRLHLPIITNKDVEFQIAKKKYHLEIGNLYATNVAEKHSVQNLGENDRIHIVIDIEINPLLKNIVSNAIIKAIN